MKVKRIINNPVSSNCFVLYEDTGDLCSCVIIDPGSENSDELFAFLIEKKLCPVYLILTHEHFDHCWGVNDLRNRFPEMKLVCSRECSDSIQSSKRNCSLFYDYLKAFEVAQADVKIDANAYIMTCGDINMTILRTPGHSNGSISIVIDNIIFTGDALIPGYKTITKLPTASVEEQIKTETFFKTLEGYMIYPGHESPLIFDSSLFKWCI